MKNKIILAAFAALMTSSLFAQAKGCHIKTLEAQISRFDFDVFLIRQRIYFQINAYLKATAIHPNISPDYMTERPAEDDYEAYARGITDVEIDNVIRYNALKNFADTYTEEAIETKTLIKAAITEANGVIDHVENCAKKNVQPKKKKERLAEIKALSKSLGISEEENEKFVKTLKETIIKLNQNKDVFISKEMKGLEDKFEKLLVPTL